MIDRQGGSGNGNSSGVETRLQRSGARRGTSSARFKEGKGETPLSRGLSRAPQPICGAEHLPSIGAGLFFSDPVAPAPSCPALVTSAERGGRVVVVVISSRWYSHARRILSPRSQESFHVHRPREGCLCGWDMIPFGSRVTGLSGRWCHHCPCHSRIIIGPIDAKIN